ncbi:glycosyltransferase involved in cell wall biosynthesis [Cytobacillus horneckiae]|uniref:glycosyltransferase n=1 Tax=Cytobacillus horneckiae TaxID=549687 RepID=UPI0019D26C58|nr:glycosyltransferase [Cytobacillus horneckiae]
MKKQSILFMIINMNVGGTERALLNMINEIPKDKYEITVLMLEKFGGFLSFIPDWVKVDYIDGYDQFKPLIKKPLHLIAFDYLRKLKFHYFFIYLILFIVSKMTKEKSLFYRYILRNYPKPSEEYDIAIAYAGPMDFISFFIAHKVKAKKKIQWIHFDVTKIGFNTRFAKKVYEYFYQVNVVSEEAKNCLVKLTPSLKNKIFVFPNLISKEMIIRQANISEGFKDNYNGIRILTVGRLSFEKGQDIAIKAAAKLIKDGMNVRWYCIGDGIAIQEYERLIKKLNMKEHFLLLGSDSNPYPFMKQCDLYVQPSRHEGYCMTVAEAKIFNKMIICTNFTGAKEHMDDGKIGKIVPVNDPERLYKGIKEIIESNKLLFLDKDNLIKSPKTTN